MSQTLGIGCRHGQLFQLVHLHLPISTAATTSTHSSSPTFGIWHSRLGHVSLGRLRFLVSKGVLGPTLNEHLDCQSCQLAKQPALSFNKSTSVSSAPFDLIHSDIWGPSPTSTMGGSQYFVIFVDDFSQYTWLYLLKNRSQLQQTYYDFSHMVKTQFSHDIKVSSAQTMLKNIVKPLFLPFYENMALFPTALALVLLNRMGGRNVNTVICLILLVPC